MKLTLLVGVNLPLSSWKEWFWELASSFPWDNRCDGCYELAVFEEEERRFLVSKKHLRNRDHYLRTKRHDHQSISAQRGDKPLGLSSESEGKSKARISSSLSSLVYLGLLPWATLAAATFLLSDGENWYLHLDIIRWLWKHRKLFLLKTYVRTRVKMGLSSIQLNNYYVWTDMHARSIYQTFSITFTLLHIMIIAADLKKKCDKRSLLSRYQKVPTFGRPFIIISFPNRARKHVDFLSRLFLLTSFCDL